MNADSSALTSQRLVAENAVHDRWIFGLALITLAVVAAYPVGLANPDARLYLAAGRLIVQGEYQYGQDPFAYAPHQPQGWASWQRLLGSLGLGPKQLEWINAGWLAEVIFYVVYACGGGAGLVATRVLMVLAVALWLQRAAIHASELSVKAIGRGRGLAFAKADETEAVKKAAPPFASWFAIGVLLTGLVVSMRMHVRPESFGLLFLAIMLSLLAEPPKSGSSASSPPGALPQRWGLRLSQLGRGRRWWILPGLFLLWANCDWSAILGLAVLLLYWAGQHLQSLWGPDRYAGDVLQYEDRRALGRVILACVAACLINPFHVHVFDPSPLLFPENAALLQSASVQARRLGTSPFSAAYFTDAAGRWVGLSLAEWSYFVLVVVSAAGWWLGRAHWRWSWFLVSLLGFALSAYLTKYTAWFVILALPGAWVSWRGYLSERFGETPRVTRRALLWTQLGRLAAVGTLLLLLVLTLWPRGDTGTAMGWVTGRGWGFSLFEDTSAEQAARTAADWHRTGQLSGRALHLAWVHSGTYWAYQQPRSTWLDLRAGLFTPQAVNDFLTVVQALERTGTSEGQRERRRWQELLRQYDVSHIVVHMDHTVSRVDMARRPVQVPLLPLLLADRDEQGQPVWELLDYIDGETFLLAWTGSPHWQHLQSLRFSPLKRWRETSESLKGTALVARDREPWRTLRIYFSGQPAAPPLSTTAARWVFNLVYDLRQRLASSRQQAEGVLLSSQLAGWLGSVPSESMLAMVTKMGTIAVEGWPNLPRWPRFAYEADALLWMAWRWGREGLLESPRHPLTWTVCYNVGNFLDTHEAQFTEGRRHEARLLARMFLLRQLTRLQPDFADAQLELARRFLERGCDDLALFAAEQFLRVPGEAGSEQQTAQKRLEEYLGMSLEQLRQRVNEARSRLEPVARAFLQPTTMQARPAEALAHAREVWQARLAGLALELLQPMTRSLSPRQPEFGEAVRLLADVYVQTGDALSLHRLLEQPWAQAAFGPERYPLLRALTASALADPQSESRFRRQLEERLQQSAAQSFLQGAIQLALGGDIGPAGSFFHGLFLQQQALTRSRERLLNLLAIASAHLEAGQLAQARIDFQRILELAPQEPIASLAAHYLRVLPEN